MLIAVDGTAASGKGTMAKRLAERFQLAYMDTGLLYRAIASMALNSGIPLHDEPRLQELCVKLQLADLSSPNLRTDEVASAASKVSVHPQVCGKR